MKKVILSALLACGLAFPGNAQDTKTPPETKGEKRKNATPEERAKHDANRAEKELGLSADQKSKWETAALERIKSNMPVRDKMKGSTTPEERKTLHGQAKTNMEKFDNDVKGFLSPEQKTKWEKMKEDRKKKAKERHKGKKDDLDMDDDD
jgi:periplasmic protein CpxP/Spy